MKIALFTDVYPPEINGVATSTFILHNELEKHGHEVYVVAPKKGTGQHEWSADHKILYLAGMEMKSLYGFIATSPIHMFALEEIRKLNLDIIHVQTEFGIGIFARICASQLHIPLVSTYHTTYEDYTHYVNFIHSKKVDDVAKKGVARVSKLYGDSSMEVIAPSEKTKEMLEGYGIRREITVIPTGLELDRYSPEHASEEKRHEIRREFGFSDTEKVIIYIGRIAEEKSLDIVIAGMRCAAERKLPVRLLITGGGPSLDSLKSMVREYGLEDTIRFSGPRNAEEIPDFYRACDAFVSASLSETQGMTFIEAEASGLPIFARYDDVLKDVVIPGKTGMFFRDPEDFADKIADFLKLNEEQLRQIQKNCLQQVHPYSSEVFYERVIKVYERVIEEYQYQYTIVNVKQKDSYVQLYLISNRKDELRLNVTLDTYMHYGMKTGGILIRRQVEQLKKQETEVLAYQRCLKRIAVKDRTRKETEDWLRGNTDCDEEMIQRVVDRLEENGYIDDERYCEEAVGKAEAALKGSNHIQHMLEKKGIPQEMIERNLRKYVGNEKGHAAEYARKALSSLSHESTAHIRNMLKVRLIRQGYSSEIADEVMADADLSEQEKHEEENLEAYMHKALRRLSRKYSGNDLKQRLRRTCLQKGYRSANIDEAMKKVVWSDEEDS